MGDKSTPIEDILECYDICRLCFGNDFPIFFPPKKEYAGWRRQWLGQWEKRDRVFSLSYFMFSLSEN